MPPGRDGPGTAHRPRGLRKRQLPGPRLPLLRRGALPRLKELLAPLGASSALLRALTEELDDLSDLRARIDGAICDSPPLALREGGFIRDGYDAEVDRLRTLMNGGQDAVAAIEAAEREKTGIRTLRVGYNKVLRLLSGGLQGLLRPRPGRLHTETDACQLRAVHQQEAQGSRTHDPHRKGLPGGAGSTASSATCARRSRPRSRASSARRRPVARADVLRSLAEVAAAENYCAPSVDCSDAIEITAGRHPVVEKTLRSGLFVPNDTRMDGGENLLSIITGSQHGREIDLHAPGGAHRAPRADRFLRPGEGRAHRHRGSHLHAHRRGGRPRLRPEHVHGGDDRGRRHPQKRHGERAFSSSTRSAEAPRPTTA